MTSTITVNWLKISSTLHQKFSNHYFPAPKKIAHYKWLKIDSHKWKRNLFFDDLHNSCIHLFSGNALFILRAFHLGFRRWNTRLESLDLPRSILRRVPACLHRMEVRRGLPEQRVGSRGASRDGRYILSGARPRDEGSAGKLSVRKISARRKYAESSTGSSDSVPSTLYPRVLPFIAIPLPEIGLGLVYYQCESRGED